MIGRSTQMLVLAAALSGCSAFTLINAVSPSAHYERFSDVGYGPEERQRLDVYAPRGLPTRAPLVLFFYGGGWNGGTRKNYEFVAASLTRAGFVVMIPDYRLYPEVRFPAFVEDGAGALAWALDNAERYGADPSRVYLMGHSAGAHIAALIGMDDRYLSSFGRDPAALTGFIGLSGPYDFLPIESGYLLEVFPEPNRAASQPINFVSERSPPALLIHGGEDDIVEPGNSERLAARLRSFGVPVTLKLYPETGHARVVVALAPRFDFIAQTLDDCVAFIHASERAVRASPVAPAAPAQ